MKRVQYHHVMGSKNVAQELIVFYAWGGIIAGNKGDIPRWFKMNFTIQNHSYNIANIQNINLN